MHKEINEIQNHGYDLFIKRHRYLKNQMHLDAKLIALRQIIAEKWGVFICKVNNWNILEYLESIESIVVYSKGKVVPLKNVHCSTCLENTEYGT